MFPNSYLTQEPVRNWHNDVLESVFRTHLLTWDDCQQLLQTFFTSEERDHILQEARKVALGPGVDSHNPGSAGRVRGLLPTQRPDWDPAKDQDPDPDRPLHHCLEVISQMSFTQTDLTDIPLPEPDKTFYTDGSSYVRDGTRLSRRAPPTPLRNARLS
ncbi:uncharacterized protein RBU33_014882 [Hipposideros larvatus]